MCSENRDVFSARFIVAARFIPCLGAQDPTANSRLAAAFRTGPDLVKQLRLSDVDEASCWFAGDGWWLSTQALADS